MTCPEIGLLIFCFFLMFGGSIYGYFSDRKKWNKGICKENKLPWVCQDVASDGSRLYRAGDETCWISWGVDK